MSLRGYVNKEEEEDEEKEKEEEKKFVQVFSSQEANKQLCGKHMWALSCLLLCVTLHAAKFRIS